MKSRNTNFFGAVCLENLIVFDSVTKTHGDREKRICKLSPEVVKLRKLWRSPWTLLPNIEMISEWQHSCSGRWQNFHCFNRNIIHKLPKSLNEIYNLPYGRIVLSFLSLLNRDFIISLPIWKQFTCHMKCVRQCNCRL